MPRFRDRLAIVAAQLDTPKLLYLRAFAKYMHADDSKHCCYQLMSWALRYRNSSVYLCSNSRSMLLRWQESAGATRHNMRGDR